jgi:tRNA dimethylallyltransferase
MNKKVCIVITGPTAVGKTGMAIALARHFNTDIISADSRQCYKELTIGVAKPNPEQLALVKHYFINSHSILDEVNAAVFEQYALQAVNNIFQQHDIAVMVGGTGLYIKAFCEGLDEIPAIPPAIRNNINTGYQKGGLEWLQQEVAGKDPGWYATGERENPHRLIRALEVKMATGASIRSFQQGGARGRDFKIIKIVLDLGRIELYEQINHRIDDMMGMGLLDEVRELMPYRHLNALQTVGYTELFEYLDGTITQARAIDLIKQNTRHYAKRQLTWFRKDLSAKCFPPVDFNQIIVYLRSLVQ